MDSSYFNNRNYRREGNSHQYGIYGHYSNNINISNYEDPVFYNDYKKEKRSSISNFFSFSIDEDRNQSTTGYYKKGNKYITKGFSKNDKRFLIGLSLVSLGLNYYNIRKSYIGVDNVKKDLYLDNQPYFVKKFLTYSANFDKEFVDITNPMTTPLLQISQTIVNSFIVCVWKIFIFYF